MKKTQSRRIKKDLVRVFGCRCWYCGLPAMEMELSVEHIIPKGKGGTDDLDNLGLACNICNRAKYGDDVGEFLDWLSYLRSSKFECKILTRLSKKVINSLNESTWDILRKDFHNGR